MRDSVCFLNGKFGPLAQATVSVLDRGFIFGDSIYELIPVFNGVPFRVREHLVRLANNLAAVYIDNPYSEPHWCGIIDELIQVNNGGDQSIYIQVSRGAAPRDHVPQDGMIPTVFVMSSPLEVPREVTPIKAVIQEDLRWRHCDIKSTSLLPNTLARAQAARAGAREAILVRDGSVTEGAASNVFAVIDGAIKTPPLSPYILPGVTRGLIIELMSETDSPVAEMDISEHELLRAEEVWISSSGRELVPVVALSESPVGDGLVGPVFERVLQVYRDFKASLTGG